MSKKPYPNRVGVFVCARLHEDLVDVVDMGPQDGHEGLDLRRREVAVGRQVGVESHCLYTLFSPETLFSTLFSVRRSGSGRRGAPRCLEPNS